MTSLIITVQYKLLADLQFVFTRILLFNSAIKQKPSIYSDYKTYSQNHHQNLHQHQYPKLQKHQQLEHEHEDDSHHLETEETDREEREEVRCSEWGDNYGTTSSTSDDDEEIDRDSRSEMESRSNFGSSVHNESVVPPTSAYTSVPKSKFSSKSEKSEDAASSSASWKTGHYDDNSNMRMVIRHRDLKEIVASIKEYFDKAADSGDQVSEMLETGRTQLDRSFRQLKKTVYHSSGVFSNLSSSWTSKPPLAVKYRFEPGSVGEPGGSKSLCSTLERLLAWEMKLYQEVKIATKRDSHIGYSTEEEVLPVYGTTLVTPHISDRDLELHERVRMKEINEPLHILTFRSTYFCVSRFLFA